jgi:hypothetical protein
MSRLLFPLPWRWEWMRTGGIHQIRLMTSGGSQIATFSHSLAKPYDDMAENTAHMLAAAPEVTAALQRWVEEWGEFDQFGVPKDDLTRVSVDALMKAGLRGEWSEHRDDHP